MRNKTIHKPIYRYTKHLRHPSTAYTYYIEEPILSLTNNRSSKKPPSRHQLAVLQTILQLYVAGKQKMVLLDAKGVDYKSATLVGTAISYGDIRMKLSIKSDMAVPRYEYVYLSDTDLYRFVFTRYANPFSTSNVLDMATVHGLKQHRGNLWLDRKLIFKLLQVSLHPSFAVTAGASFVRKNLLRIEDESDIEELYWALNDFLGSFHYRPHPHPHPPGSPGIYVEIPNSHSIYSVHISFSTTTCLFTVTFKRAQYAVHTYTVSGMDILIDFLVATRSDNRASIPPWLYRHISLGINFARILVNYW